jgi:hypothetical protein
MRSFDNEGLVDFFAKVCTCNNQGLIFSSYTSLLQNSFHILTQKIIHTLPKYVGFWHSVRDISTKIGSRTFAVAVFETTSVMVAAMMLTIKLITQTGSPLRVIKYCTSQVENPGKNITLPLV